MITFVSHYPKGRKAHTGDMAVGVATTLCAVLSGVRPEDLMVDEPDMTEGMDTEGVREWISNHRMLSYHAINNTNTTGLEPGAIVGISIGGVILGVLLLLAVWWYCRSPARQSSGYAQAAFNEPPEFAPVYPGGSSSIFANLAGTEELGSTLHAPQSARNESRYEDLVGMPLLTLGSRRDGRR